MHWEWGMGQAQDQTHGQFTASMEQRLASPNREIAGKLPMHNHGSISANAHKDRA
jgi:hypothetical protein